MSHLTQVDLPNFGEEPTLPLIGPAEYEQRLNQAVERMAAHGLDVLVVYADREHFANMSFLTGFDPRFEEALLVLDRQGQRTLLAGNEWIHFPPHESLRCQTVLFQELSLLGQDRSGVRSLRQILGEAGVARGRVVGTAGWKHFESAHLVDGLQQAIEIPAYVVDLLRDMTGERANVRNANSIFMDAQDGLRVINSVDQIAQFEYAAIRSSNSIRRILEHLREGTTELELAKLLDSGGLPFSCHPVVRCGDWRPCLDPTQRLARRGQFFLFGFGIWGSLTCRAGAIAAGPADLPADAGPFYEKMFRNYFDVSLAWLGALRVGAKAADVYAAAESARDKQLYRFLCNPGHYIHLDEWVHSPFAAGSQMELRSGMAIQLDIIPVSLGPECSINAEDGYVLADAAMRQELKRKHPRCWMRMQSRRRFLTETIGAKLDESVLPVSNTAGWLTPYGLRLDHALIAG